MSAMRTEISYVVPVGEIVLAQRHGGLQAIGDCVLGAHPIPKYTKRLTGLTTSTLGGLD